MKPILSLMLLAAAALFTACVHTAPDKQAAKPSIPILSRKDWAAQPAILPMKTHSPRFITIHHTATLQKPNRSLAAKLQALQQFSQRADTLASGKVKPPWPDVPYHFYIDCHGGIAEGRELQYVGDTNTEYDPTGHLLVVLEGNFEQEQPTPEQMTALKELVASLARRWHISVAQIKGHQDYAKTLCPGSHLEARLAEIRNVVAGQ